MNLEDSFVELSFSPEGFLYFNQKDKLPPAFVALHNLFNKDSSLGLLHLGLLDFTVQLSPSMSFWQTFARQLITRVCKLPADSTRIDSIPTLTEEELQHFLNQAPFMRGSEYLSKASLSILWSNIENALQNAFSSFSGTIQEFLAQYNTHWTLIGRVCFHLAEQKNCQQFPFAFLATYTTQLCSRTTAQHIPFKRALHASAQEKTQLLSLLAPVQKAAASSAFVKNLVDSGEIFEATPWSIQKAYQFLQDIPTMEASGIVVRVPNWWSLKNRPKLKAELQIGTEKQSLFNTENLLDFNIQLAIGEEPLTEEEWIALQEGTENLVQIKGKWVEVDKDKLTSILSHWKKIKQAAKNGMSISEAFRLLAGVHLSQSPDAESEWSDIKPGAWLQTVFEQLKNPTDFPQQALCKLRGILRPYQAKGVQWLWSLYQLRLGGCLADDMGLGKTIQILSLLLAIKELAPSKKPHLLVVPASLLGNWQAEAAKFAPSLKLSIAHSSVAKSNFSEADLVITTYSFVCRWNTLQEHEWDLVILDEAQAIKNASSKQARSIKLLKSQSRLALTGTPVENRIGDLWSLFDFIFPGLLGSAHAFSSYAKKLNADTSCRSHFITTLRKLTQPYILRRLKTDSHVISDLPDKTEIKTYCSLSKEQILLYQGAIQELTQKLNTEDPMQRRGAILSTLLHLKQICNHPAHAQGIGEYAEHLSGKMIRLREICEAISEKQERLLLFTQFKEIIPHLFSFLSEIFEQPGLALHGATPVSKRAQLVEQFQQNLGPPFFILSLKAGGTGLNLTKANHVIHFDRWWNPAVENQATDRAYRIGQKHPVLVHQFICKGTVEEKIDKLIDSKKNLSKELLEGSKELQFTELSNEQIIQMVSLNIHQALGVGK